MNLNNNYCFKKLTLQYHIYKQLANLNNIELFMQCKLLFKDSSALDVGLTSLNTAVADKQIKIL